MSTAILTFKSQQEKAITILLRLREFILQGVKLDVKIDPSILKKLDHSLDELEQDKLKVVLIGGFSEGKTSIAAAWLEKFDKKSMNISQQESSNQVKVYDVSNDMVLIDTPGLFGFKETDTVEHEKYKDITKKYISEAHLILYVMNPANPLKDSHKLDLEWLFRDLNLLPRTVFVLGRFDEVSDVEDEWDYNQNLKIKQENVVSRLKNLISLSSEEENDVLIVGVSANPFDMGLDYWLDNAEQYKKLSHINTLQKATTTIMENNGGLLKIAYEAQKSIIQDVLSKELPNAKKQNDEINIQVNKLKQALKNMEEELSQTNSRMNKARINLINFISSHFKQLIMRVKGCSQETFSSFFEEEIGNNGIVLEKNLQIEFEKQIGSISADLNQTQSEFKSEVERFDSVMETIGKKGITYLLNSNLISSQNIILARDGIVSIGKFLGADLANLLKFKPWGAINFAKGLNGVLVFAGAALELWNTYSEIKKEQEFNNTVETFVKNLDEQRQGLLNLLDKDSFITDFFPVYASLQEQLTIIRNEIEKNEQRKQCFEDWCMQGESISDDFKNLKEMY